jgi:nicotinic acid mononucleotide adenylyltransferase
LVVYPRVGVTVHPAMHEDVLPGLAEQVIMLDAPLIEVSSTAVAQWMAERRSVRYMVPDSVLTYIDDTQLYRRGS